MRRLLSLALLLVLTAPAAAGSQAAHALWERGMTLWKSGDTNRYPEVADCFRKALAADPQNPDYHSYLGRILLDLGEVKEASAELRWSLGFHPWSKGVICTTHLAQGQCWELKGHPAQARIEYRKALAAAPGEALKDELMARTTLTTWPRAVQPHCVVVHPPAMSRPRAEDAARTCEATVARAIALGRIELSHPVYVYLLEGDTQARHLGVTPGTALEGRQQLYELAADSPQAWQTALVRLVSDRMADTHCSDTVIRNGFFTWLEGGGAALFDTGEARKALETRPSLSDLRATRNWEGAPSLYAASFVQYLVTTYGMDAFHAFWQQPDPEKGAVEAFHRPLRDLEAEWHGAVIVSPSSPSASPAPGGNGSGPR